MISPASSPCKLVPVFWLRCQYYCVRTAASQPSRTSTSSNERGNYNVKVSKSSFCTGATGTDPLSIAYAGAIRAPKSQQALARNDFQFSDFAEKDVFEARGLTSRSGAATKRLRRAQLQIQTCPIRIPSADIEPTNPPLSITRESSALKLPFSLALGQTPICLDRRTVLEEGSPVHQYQNYAPV